MNFSLWLRSYNMFGGPSVCRFVPHFLVDGARDFGPAVTEIEVTALVAHPGPPRPTLEASFAQFNALRADPPRITFRKSRQKVEIVYSTEVIDAVEWEGRVAPSPERFHQVAEEVVHVLGC